MSENMEELKEETIEDTESTVCVVDMKLRDDDTAKSEQSVRLTPTGKISHAKTRVYTQRYRKEWEQMPDFKDWLTSVPYEATRAYCKFCERNLHAHRLSLLKHMCTLKHQRAAVQYNKSVTDINKTEDETLSEEKYITENDDEDEDETSYDETSYVQETEETTLEDEVQEEIVEMETESEIPVFKKIRLQKDNSQDTLAQAIAEADFIDDTEPIQLEMIVETEPDDNEEEDSKSYLISCSNPPKESFKQKENSRKEKNTDENLNTENEDVKTQTIVPKSMNVTLESDDQNKVYFFSSGGKSYTLVKATNPIVLNQARKIAMQPKFAQNNPKNNKELNTINISSANTVSQAVAPKNPAVLNTASVLKNSLIVRKPFISTNVIDTSKGNPVSGLQVSLYKLQDGRWTFIHESATSASGNCSDFADTKYKLSTGRYKLHYDTEKYYSCKKISSFYPFIEIVFDIKDPNGTYHFPLLVSPFSYSTYKSSSKPN